MAQSFFHTAYKFFSATVFVAVSLTGLYAQSLQMKFDHLGIEDGLSESIVLSIAQDRQGYMWFGTAEGLNRYDGYSITIFRHQKNDSTSLIHNYAQVLHKAASGVLWVGTLGGLDWYEPEKEQFHHIRLNTGDVTGIANEFTIQSILEDASGNLWVGTGGGGVFRLGIRYSGNANVEITSVQRFIDNPEVSDDLRGMFANPVFRDNEGKIWMCALDSGISIYDPAKAIFFHLEHDPQDYRTISSNSVRTVLIDNKKNLWIGTEGEGLNRYDSSSNTFIRYNSKEVGARKIPDDVIRAHYEDRKGRIWVATDGGGLLLYNDKSDSFEVFRHISSEQRSIANDRVISIYEDNSGTLWFGTWGSGIDRWSPIKEKFSNDENTNIIHRNLKNKFIISLFEDSKKNLWVGTHGGGAVAFDPFTKTVELFEPQESKLNALVNGMVWSIREDDNGNIWFATDMGVDMLDRKSDNFTHYNDSPKASGRLGNRYTGHAKPIGDAVWVTTDKGLDKINRKTGSITNFPFKLAGIDTTQGYTSGLFYDSNGIFWLGTTPIITFDTKRELYVPSPVTIGKVPVSCIEGDSRGNVIIGTFGDGFYIFETSRKQISHFTEIQGLSNNVVYGMLEDKQGNYWLSTNRGISKFTPQTVSFKNYDVSDGLQSNEFNRCAFFADANGKMYFGGVNGFNAFYADSIINNPHIPPVIMTGFRRLNEPVKFPSALPFVKTISLKHDENFFSFEFAALNFVDQERNMYAYMLRGFDLKWVNSETRRFASYTNVPPGEYTFTVKASNNDGIWNETGTSVQVIVYPPLWRTWWAYSFYALFLLTSVAGARWLVKNWKIIIANRRAQYLSHYKLMQLLGEGGMGKVYKALDVNTKSIVALKILNPALLKDDENKKRLLQEGRLLSSFSHPYIVKVLEVNDSEQGAYIAMEYLSGGTLKNYLEQNPFPPLQEIKRITIQICTGLCEIHSHKIIHRDIKSANIMFDESGTVRIMDFGLSKSPLVTTMTTLGTVIGTLGYVAPEQVTGLNADMRVDIFSFGVLLYELLTKKMPFTGENEIAVIHSIFNTQPVPPSHLNERAPKELDNIVATCLQKDPEKRFSSSTAVKVELEKDFW